VSAVIEIVTRLSLALFLSLSFALLMAWGWDRSDRISVDVATDTNIPATLAPQALLRP
jgi:hypothetical protein